MFNTILHIIMKPLIIFIAALFIISPSNGQSIRDNKSSILKNVLGLDYKVVIEQLNIDEAAGKGSLINHILIEDEHELFSIMYACAEQNKIYGFQYGKNEIFGRLKDLIIVQTELAKINLLNSYVRTLDNSFLHKSDQKWLWYDKTEHLLSHRYELSTGKDINNVGYVMLEISYSFSE